MINKIIDVYIAWHFSRPKWARCLLKASGFILAFSTAPLWFPAIVVIYLVLTVLVGIVEFFESA